MSHFSRLCAWPAALRDVGERGAATQSSAATVNIRAVLRVRYSIQLLSLAVLMLSAPAGVFAQSTSFATVIQNNAAMQSNLTQQIMNSTVFRANQAGTSAGPASCMPPYELMRGVNGMIPPELQSDPRYQQYLRCQQGQSNPQYAQQPAPEQPSLPVAQHLPITATDFVPVLSGHPIVDQALANMPIAPVQRVQLRNAVELMFQRVATEYRGNNLAVSIAIAYATARFTLDGSQPNAQQAREIIFGINDRLAQQPQFALMSPVEKQNNSDSLIFQSAMISVLRDLGQRDPQSRQQAVDLSRVVVQNLTGR